jgi:LysR family transcriptional regulator, glycine cleavage system transcriptional activator
MLGLSRFHLNGLRAIEAVARLGNLEAAADELGVTPGAISQQIGRTERIMGRSAFIRGQRGLLPSSDLRPFFLHLHAGFRELAVAADKVGRDRQTRLTVSVAPVFASKWLVPRLGRFQAQHSALQILIDANAEIIDPDVTGIDLAIRVGRGPWPNVVATSLIEQLVFPVCHPSLAARLREPADLRTAPIVRDVGSIELWDVWLQAHGLAQGDLGDGPQYSDSALCLDAAIAGQGVMLAWQSLSADALADGKLVRPFRRCVASGASYWLVRSKSARHEPRMQLFENWLKSEIALSLDPIQ